MFVKESLSMGSEVVSCLFVWAAEFYRSSKFVSCVLRTRCVNQVQAVIGFGTLLCFVLQATEKEKH